MKITQIIVECGTTLPHPRYQYSSIRESVSATATLAPDDVPDAVIAYLQEWLSAALAVRIQQRLKEEP